MMGGAVPAARWEKGKGDAMLEQAKLVGVGLAVLGATVLGMLTLVAELRQPWPEDGSDSWTQIAISEQAPAPYVIQDTASK
jgi:hypothetical protein